MNRARTLSLPPEAALRIREEIQKAGGREVSFLAAVDPEGRIHDPRAVARGNRGAVLAVAEGAPDGGVVIHNHPSGLLEPSDADLGVAARLYQEGLGTAIVDNEATRLYVVVEPPVPRTRVLLDQDRVEAIVSPGGALAARHPGYEDRPGQRTMLRSVVQAFNEGGIRVVEAGTGTGKSLAYLLPAALWAAENGERTVISTNTIHLQEQLTGKDLPLVRELLDVPVRWALVKGRGNYVSIRRARLAAASQQQLFDTDRTAELSALLEWVDETRDGSLADLTTPPSDEVWDEVRSDADVCLRARCPHFQECFYQKARRSASAAQLLIVNHHLLFSDLAIRRGVGGFEQSAVLPPFRRLVLDEAHNVEDAATSHLGVELSRYGLFRLLSRLDRKGRGVLAAVEERLRGSTDDAEARALLERTEGRVRPSLERARSRLALFFDELDPMVPDPDAGPRRIGAGTSGPDPLDDLGLQEAVEALIRAFAELRREVKGLKERIEETLEWRESLEERLLDLGSVGHRLEAAVEGIRTVFQADAAAELVLPRVRWLEGRRARGGGRGIVMAAAPVEPGPLLREELFRHMESAVLTSATMATRGGSFKHIRERLGLGESDPRGRPPGGESWEEPDVDRGPGFEPLGAGPLAVEPLAVEPLGVSELDVPSPFDFREQALLVVPTDLPPPGRGEPAFQEATARVAADLADITGGGLFLLFTSHRALRDVARLLRAAGVEGRFPLFVQGEAPRTRLLEDFAVSGSGLLLGNASFWEGVDVPGWPLRGIVIQKIPFRVPTEPVTEARLEAVEARGRNPFWEYMLPQAALRLKQGFGRLIRTRTDRGAVLLLDDRILSRRYGRILRESLPPAPLEKGEWPLLAERLRAFYRTAPVHAGSLTCLEEEAP